MNGFSMALEDNHDTHIVNFTFLWLKNICVNDGIVSAEDKLFEESEISP